MFAILHRVSFWAEIDQTTILASARVNISKKILKGQGILKVFNRWCMHPPLISPDMLIAEFS
jgi:hypothetical protein